MEISLSLPSGELVNFVSFRMKKRREVEKKSKKRIGGGRGSTVSTIGDHDKSPPYRRVVHWGKEGRTMKDRASAWNVNSSSSSACHRGVINCKLYYVVNISWSSHNRCLMLQLTTTKPRPRIMWGITSNWTNRGRIPMDGRELAGWMKNRAHQHWICWTFIKFICEGGWSSYFSQSTGN